MHESFWVEKDSGAPATREVLMIALQRLEHVLVRSSDSAEATEATLDRVALDVGRVVSSASLRPAVGVEVCQCPPEFSGESCQDPGRGFFRWSHEGHIMTTLISLVGEAKKCECNGRAEACHPETGKCLVSIVQWKLNFMITLN